MGEVLVKLSICYEWFTVNIEVVNALLLCEICKCIYVGARYLWKCHKLLKNNYETYSANNMKIY